jgi:SAM-dependent methyltransferase
MSTPGALPLPPIEMIRRIGPMDEGKDPYPTFERTGAEHREMIEAALPDDWSWAGTRTLDFGCGAARIMRHFLPESGEAEFWGCDIDTVSIDWLTQNMSPPFHFFTTEEVPGLPQEDASFDLIYALSVYTHLADDWAGWMVEHHRVLKPGGLLWTSFLGEGMIEALIGESWDEDRIGSNPLMARYPWDKGGPIVFNSPWWIRAHWGRAFEIVALEPRMGPEAMVDHGWVLLRKRDVAVDAELLEALEPDEPREITALQHLVEQLRAETVELRPAVEAQQARLEAVEAENERLRARVARADEAAQQLRELRTSSSWRLTAPLREAKARLTRGR